jgi:hypothetical protein
MMAKREVSRRKEKGSSPRTVPDYDHSDDKKAEAFPASLRSALTLKLLRLMVWRSFRRPSLIISWSPLALCAIILVTSSLRVCSFPPVVTKTSGIRQQRPAMLQTLDAVACSVKQLNLRDKPPHWVKNRKHHYFTIKKVSELPLPDSLDKDCIPLGDWQEQHKIINCNTFHEIDITDISKAALIGKGGQNTVWSVQEYAGTRRALKIPGWILRQYISDDEYIPTPFYYEQDHLTQALIYDELSFSPHIANMYGFCSHSNLMEYSSETLLDLVDKKEFRDKDELFRIAYDVARAVADAHHFDSKGRATIVHRDIKVNQFILVNGMYRLNDFNLAHLMRWNREKDEYCEFEGRGYKTNYKAPEEYLDAIGNYTFKSEKADIYSLGYVLRFLMTGEEPFEDDYTDDEKWVKLFMGGKRLTVDQSTQEDTHPFDVVVGNMINKCLAEDPSERPTSQEVAEYLYIDLINAGLTPTPTN